MNKIAYGIMCILFNGIGVPCFMQGNVGAGILRIFLGFISLGVIFIINDIMGLVLGIRVLCMSNAEFEEKKDTLCKGVPAGFPERD